MSQQISPEDRAKRKRADDSSSELQSDSCSEESKKKKKKRKHDRSSVKKKHKKEKKKKSSSKETKKNKKFHKRHKTALDEEMAAQEIVGPTVTITTPAVAMAEPRGAQRSLGPMTKEQYEKRQSTTRRVFDEDTGRYRLIRGDGEIVEEIVSKQRQQQINKLATAGDGMSFQSGLTQFYK